MFRAMLESVGEAVYCIDQEGLCTFMNQGAASLLGFTPEECLGRNMHQLIHHSKPDGTLFPASECPISASAKSGTPTELEDDVMWQRDGTAIPVAYIIRPFLTGTPQGGATVTVRDLRVSKRSEATLQERARVSLLTADIGIALTRSNDLPEMLTMCVEAIVEHLDAAFARVWTVDAAGTTLELQASAGMYTHINGGHARIPVGKFKIGLIAQEQKPHLTNEVETDPRVADHEWAVREGMK